MRATGIRLFTDGIRLTVNSPKNPLTDPQREFLRAHKPALIEALLVPSRVWSLILDDGTELDTVAGHPMDLDEVRSDYPEGRWFCSRGSRQQRAADAA
jgi:hypothetical protein